jgi:hypothetical protein
MVWICDIDQYGAPVYNWCAGVMLSQASYYPTPGDHRCLMGLVSDVYPHYFDDGSHLVWGNWHAGVFAWP